MTEGFNDAASPNPQGFDILLDGKKEYVVRFDADGKGFYFQAIKTHQGVWDIGFGEEKKLGAGVHTAAMTNDPNISQFKVLRGVERSLAKFIEAKKPESLAFTAANHEESRVKLYGRVSKEIGKTYGYSSEIKVYPANTEYILTKKAPTPATGPISPTTMLGGQQTFAQNPAQQVQMNQEIKYNC
jgi:hypothetical protein